MSKTAYYTVNAITLYRLIAAPLLVLLVFTQQVELFKWLLVISFFTDAIDGWLARRFKVSSIMGARLDSIADNLTIVAAMIGVFVLKPDFLREVKLSLILLFIVYIIQNIIAYARYKKPSSFHTYLAKLSAILQGVFLILLFWLPEPLYVLYYIAIIVTAIDLLEEIVLVFILPGWEANVKGLYWVMKRNRERPTA